MSVPVNVVVERELLVHANAPVREDAHADSGHDRPFRDVTVWVAGMFREAADSAAFGRVDVLWRRRSEEAAKGVGVRRGVKKKRRR